MLRKRAGEVAAFKDYEPSKNETPMVKATPVKGAAAFKDIAPFKYGGGWKVSVTVNYDDIVVCHSKIQSSKEEDEFEFKWELYTILSKRALSMKTAFVTVPFVFVHSQMKASKCEKLQQIFKHVL